MVRRSNKKQPWPPPKARLKALIEGAIIDAYNESEQRTAFYSLLAEHLHMPFDTQILDATATVERLAMRADEEIVAICRRGRSRQAIPILDLPLPKPQPTGAEWIEAYRLWTAGT